MHALSTAIYASSTNVWFQVQKEIDDVIGSDRQPTGDDRERMPFANAVLLEMQRQRPVTPMAVPHHTHYQTELLGYTIPAKTGQKFRYEF